jgi:hypothetical protein
MLEEQRTEAEQTPRAESRGRKGIKAKRRRGGTVASNDGRLGEMKARRIKRVSSRGEDEAATRRTVTQRRP